MKKTFFDTAPMGWNSWDCYGAGVTEEALIGNAEYMAKHLKAFGWEYIVCDIQWYEPRANSTVYNNFADLCIDEYSRVIPAVNRFPSAANGVGFKSISDRIHEMGLKFGIHILRGIPRSAVHSNTPIMCDGVTARDIASQYSLCPWNTDMYGVDASQKGAKEYYNSLFELYASWGVDFVKVDDIACTEFKPTDPYSARAEIELIREAINNCGRDMVLSLSPGPAPIWEHEHLAAYADMWRMSGDFWDTWESLYKMFGLCSAWAPYAKRGAYPDCDMLPLGKIEVNCAEKRRYTRFTKDEQITMMNLWCIFRSPLMIGGELRENDDFTLSLLTNPDLLEMHRYSENAREVSRTYDKVIWAADGNDCGYIAFFNLNDSEAVIRADLADIFSANPSELYDIHSKEHLSDCRTISVVLAPHASKAYKVYI